MNPANGDRPASLNEEESFPSLSVDDSALSPSEGPQDVGSDIGPYKLLRVLGQGGFGTVCLAEQDAPIRRRVALKIIKFGMDTRQVIARFEMEKQTLALLNHPNIARVFDAGATEDGRPYFVMEYVEGSSITEYSDRQCLAIKERLELFIPVCEAIHHAYQKGIIHRDIKPSNILVRTDGNRRTPIVIVLVWPKL